jgi:hypothetical protein
MQITAERPRSLCMQDRRFARPVFLRREKKRPGTVSERDKWRNPSDWCFSKDFRTEERRFRAWPERRKASARAMPKVLPEQTE